LRWLVVLTRGSGKNFKSRFQSTEYYIAGWKLPEKVLLEPLLEAGERFGATLLERELSSPLHSIHATA
jgi:hypothetical protein